MQSAEEDSTDLDDAARRAVVNRILINDPYELYEHQSHYSARFAQTGRGQLALDSSIVQLPGVSITRTVVETALTSETLIDPSMVGFLVPLNLRGELKYNGKTAKRSSIFVASSTDANITAGWSRDNIAVTLPRAEVTATIAALNGVDPTEVRVDGGELTLPEAAADRLRQRMICAIESAMADPEALADPRHAAQLSSEIANTMLDFYLCARPVDDDRTRGNAISTATVRRAVDWFMERPDRPIALADLCKAAGVSASTLNTAFQHVCDQSPAQYLKQRRMTEARRALISNTPEAMSVKRAALEAGLTELGRFSVEYRRMFGESPSTTLSR